MGKSRDRPSKARHIFKNPSKPAQAGISKRPPKTQKPHKSIVTEPTIAFEPTDRILLVGEGDFSFSFSLLTTHGCVSLVATCFDDRSTLLAKYPQAASHIEALEAEDDCKVLYSVDATKLGKPGLNGSGGKEVKKGGFNEIVFNFPHVGGLTKDVDRQVRHNQELVLGFLTAAKPLLAHQGSIIVTMFEGEPYVRWDIRGLARHAGLQIERSFLFSPDLYPEYKHARTLGNIQGGGGWKGEDRSARTFILILSDGTSEQRHHKPKTKKPDTDSEDD